MTVTSELNRLVCIVLDALPDVTVVTEKKNDREWADFMLGNSHILASWQQNKGFIILNITDSQRDIRCSERATTESSTVVDTTKAVVMVITSLTTGPSTRLEEDDLNFDELTSSAPQPNTQDTTTVKNSCKFVIGSEVVLKGYANMSTAPVMSVKDIGVDEDNYIECVWFDNNNVCQIHYFPPECLELYDSEH